MLYAEENPESKSVISWLFTKSKDSLSATWDYLKTDIVDNGFVASAQAVTIPFKIIDKASTKLLFGLAVVVVGLYYLNKIKS